MLHKCQKNCSKKRVRSHIQFLLSSNNPEVFKKTLHGLSMGNGGFKPRELIRNHGCRIKNGLKYRK